MSEIKEKEKSNYFWDGFFIACLAMFVVVVAPICIYNEIYYNCYVETLKQDFVKFQQEAIDKHYAVIKEVYLDCESKKIVMWKD